MKLIKRQKCVITGNDNFQKLHTFKDYPLFMGCTEQSIDEDITVDMEWVISKPNGVIQLKNLIPLDVLYSENHANSIGNIWKNHHKQLSNFIQKYNPKIGVLEIGGAHGYLSMLFQELNDIKWTIIEPNPVPMKGCKAEFIKGLFSKDLTFNVNYDLIVHSHVMEHIYDPKKFLNSLSSLINDDQKIIFSVPNMRKMLENKYTNCINFEHTILLNEPFIEYILGINKFKIIEKKYFMDDHSIFYCIKKDETINKKNLTIKNLYKTNTQVFSEYVNYYKDIIEVINLKISQVLDENKVYLFGAHVFAQHLIINGLNTANIEYILDNDNKKHGKRLYGTKLKVRSPKILSDENKPIVILKAGIYNEEIKSDIIKNINSSTIFIE